MLWHLIDPRVETPEESLLELSRLRNLFPWTSSAPPDDCGFSPFVTIPRRRRDTAFAKIRSRVLGTALVAEKLGVA